MPRNNTLDRRAGPSLPPQARPSQPLSSSLPIPHLLVAAVTAAGGWEDGSRMRMRTDAEADADRCGGECGCGSPRCGPLGRLPMPRPYWPRSPPPLSPPSLPSREPDGRSRRTGDQRLKDPARRRRRRRRMQRRQRPLGQRSLAPDGRRGIGPLGRSRHRRYSRRHCHLGSRRGGPVAPASGDLKIPRDNDDGGGCGGGSVH